MKTKTTYECEKCGMEFDSYEKCLNHEENKHIDPDFLAGFHLFKTTHPRDGIYPVVVDIPMKDGAIVRYSSIKTIRQPQEKSPCANMD